MKQLLSLVFLAVAMFAAADVAHAQTRVRIIVNGVPITNYDITQRTRLLGITGQAASSSAAERELIDEAIQVAEARRRGINVTQSQIDGAFAQIAQGSGMSVGQFSGALSQAGVNPDSLKLRISAQLAWFRLVQQRMQRSAVPNQDIMAALFAEGGGAAATTTTEYILQQIIFVVPQGSSSGVFAQRRREAENFRLRYAGCDGAIQQASGLRDVVVRSIGRRMDSELSGAQGASVRSTAVGRTTSPQQIPTGIELLGVCSVRELQSTADARAEVENRLALAKGEEIGQEYLAELRATAIIEYR